jgi:hypothetical protein
MALVTKTYRWETDGGSYEFPKPEITPIEWELLKKAWGSDEGFEAPGLADEMTDVFDVCVDDFEIDDAIEHLVDRGMLRKDWRSDETRYLITDYGKKQLFPDITGSRGGGPHHKTDIKTLLDCFQGYGYFTYADRGFGGRKPDIYLLKPKGPHEWDFDHPIGVEVEWKPGKHRDRVRENIGKARRMPVYFYTRRRRWKKSIEDVAREMGVRIVSVDEFFERWQGPNTITVYAPESTSPEVIEKTFEFKRKGYHFSIRGQAYLYARRKVGGCDEEVYVGRIFDDFKKRIDGEKVFDEASGRMLRPVVLEKTIKWVWV